MPVPRWTQFDSPDALLEAGGEASEVLMAALTQRVAHLGSGQVLEVLSQAENAPLDALTWCQLTGHELMGMLSEGKATRFWIRKRPAENQESQRGCGTRGGD